MKTWIKRTLAAMFGVTLLAGGIAACSHHHHGPHWGRASAEDVARWREKALARAGKELQLDAAQSERLGQLFDRINEQRLALAASGTDPRSALRDLVAGERFDRAKAAAWIDGKAQAITGQSPKVIAAAGDFFDSLKPEQQARLRQYLERRHGWRS